MFHSFLSHAQNSSDGELLFFGHVCAISERVTKVKGSLLSTNSASYLLPAVPDRGKAHTHAAREEASYIEGNYSPVSARDRRCNCWYTENNEQHRERRC